MRLDAELQRMTWKIKWDDLLFNDVTKSISSSRPSLVSTHWTGIHKVPSMMHQVKIIWKHYTKYQAQEKSKRNKNKNVQFNHRVVTSCKYFNVSYCNFV